MRQTGWGAEHGAENMQVDVKYVYKIDYVSKEAAEYSEIKERYYSFLLYLSSARVQYNSSIWKCKQLSVSRQLFQHITKNLLGLEVFTGRGGSEAVRHTLRDSLGRMVSMVEKSVTSNRCSACGSDTTLLSSASSTPVRPGFQYK